MFLIAKYERGAYHFDANFLPQFSLETAQAVMMKYKLNSAEYVIVQIHTQAEALAA